MKTKDRVAAIGKYTEWVNGLPEEWLRRMVIDAFWKGHFNGRNPGELHELEQFFLLESEKGLSMVPR